MAIYDQETFDPIATVVRLSSVDSTRPFQVATRIRPDTSTSTARLCRPRLKLPTGPMKASGCGRFDGLAVINELTELKWITMEPSDQPYPF